MTKWNQKKDTESNQSIRVNAGDNYRVEKLDVVLLEPFPKNYHSIMKRRSSATALNEHCTSPSIKRTKVHAQRKFAQGSNNYTTSPTKLLKPNDPSIQPFSPETNNVVNSDDHVLNNFSNLPTIDDFLTFLCYRETDVLPQRLNYLNTPQFESIPAKKKSLKSNSTSSSSLPSSKSSFDHDKASEKVDSNFRSKKKLPEFPLRSKELKCKAIINKASRSLTLKHNQRLRKTVQTKFNDSKLPNFKVKNTSNKFPSSKNNVDVKVNNVENHITRTTNAIKVTSKNIEPETKRVTRRNSNLNDLEFIKLPAQRSQTKSISSPSPKELPASDDTSKKIPSRSLRVSVAKLPSSFASSISPIKRSTRLATARLESNLKTPNKSSRPTRKTKEAATLYMETLGKDLLRGEDIYDEDALSPESYFESPTIELATPIKELKEPPKKPKLANTARKSASKLIKNPANKTVPLKAGDKIHKPVRKIIKKDRSQIEKLNDELKKIVEDEPLIEKLDHITKSIDVDRELETIDQTLNSTKVEGPNEIKLSKEFVENNNKSENRGSLLNDEKDYDGIENIDIPEFTMDISDELKNSTNRFPHDENIAEQKIINDELKKDTITGEHIENIVLPEEKDIVEETQNLVQQKVEKTIKNSTTKNCSKKSTEKSRKSELPIPTKKRKFSFTGCPQKTKLEDPKIPAKNIEKPTEKIEKTAISSSTVKNCLKKPTKIEKPGDSNLDSENILKKSTEKLEKAEIISKKSIEKIEKPEPASKKIAEKIEKLEIPSKKSIEKTNAITKKSTNVEKAEVPLKKSAEKIEKSQVVSEKPVEKAEKSNIQKRSTEKSEAVSKKSTEKVENSEAAFKKSSEKIEKSELISKKSSEKVKTSKALLKECTEELNEPTTVLEKSIENKIEKPEILLKKPNEKEKSQPASKKSTNKIEKPEIPVKKSTDKFEKLPVVNTVTKKCLKKSAEKLDEPEIPPKKQSIKEDNVKDSSSSAEICSKKPVQKTESPVTISTDNSLTDLDKHEPHKVDENLPHKIPNKLKPIIDPNPNNTLTVEYKADEKQLIVEPICESSTVKKNLNRKKSSVKIIRAKPCKLDEKGTPQIKTSNTTNIVEPITRSKTIQETFSAKVENITKPMPELIFANKTTTTDDLEKPLIQSIASSSNKMFCLESKKIIFKKNKTPELAEDKEESSPRKTEAFSADNENSVYAFEPDLPSTSPPFRRLKPVTPSKSLISGNSIALQVNFDSNAKIECSSSSETQVSSTTDCDDRVFYIPIQTSDTSSTLGVAVKLDTDGANQKIIMSATLVTKSSSFTTTNTTIASKLVNPEPSTSQEPAELPKKPQPKETLDKVVATADSQSSSQTLIDSPSSTVISPIYNKKVSSTTQPNQTVKIVKISKIKKSLPPQKPTLPPQKSTLLPQKPTLPPQKSTLPPQKPTLPPQKPTLPPQKPKPNPVEVKSDKTKPEEVPKPIPSTPSEILEAPTFYPSETEFNDPLKYIDTIRPVAENFGLCRIVPPSTFKPECKIADEMRFTAYNHYIHKMLHRWGPNVKEMIAIKKFLTTQNIQLTQVPVIGGMEVDLPRLYQMVQQCGGLKAVIEKERWHQVADVMKIPKLAQDRITKLDDIYCKYLLPYDILSHDEREKLFDEVEKDWNAHLKNSTDDNEIFDDVDECIIRGRTMPLSCFYRIARNTMMMYYGSVEGQKGPSTETIETEFWNHVSERKSHICVNSGSIDTGANGYGFSVAKKSTFQKHPWNLKVLTNNSASILRSLGPIMGVTVPTLHVGMLYSAYCWYRDPHGLPWIEYLHTGANKIWYGIPDEYSDQFNKTMRTLVPRYCRDKRLWLPSDTVMVPPPLLAAHNVPLSRVVQQPGQFIVVFPKAFTSCISTGYMVSESVYFAQTSWLNSAKRIFADMHESCEPSEFSLEQLLICVATDIRASLSILTEILPLLIEVRQTEIDLRNQLVKLGLGASQKIKINKKRKNKTSFNEEDIYECEICRANLFISLVINSQDETNYCLKHAVSLIQKKPTQLKHCKLMCAYSEDELEEIIRKVQDRIETKNNRKPNTK